jgi:hypothetical protein
MSTPRKQDVPEDLRREAFRALVEAQDQSVSVLESREAIARRFDLTAEQIREIEREGIDQGWPPL